jgi:hypothetical protein
MSAIADAATVELVLSDFASTDAAGKGNVIGAGVALLGINPQQGVTARFSLWASIHLPTNLCPAEFPVEFSLVDEVGDLVQLQGPTGDQPLRVAQIVQMERPNAPVSIALRDHIGSRTQVVFDFPGGIPLAPGGMYRWRLLIDGDSSHEWTYPFAVAGPPPGPVVG